VKTQIFLHAGQWTCATGQLAIACESRHLQGMSGINSGQTTAVVKLATFSRLRLWPSQVSVHSLSDPCMQTQGNGACTCCIVSRLSSRRHTCLRGSGRKRRLRFRICYKRCRSRSLCRNLLIHSAWRELWCCQQVAKTHLVIRHHSCLLLHTPTILGVHPNASLQGASSLHTWL